MNTEWLKLRTFNGDIKNGFEELVCQLARAEFIPNKIKFIRVAAPDGGVEAYCELSNGEEYGWQAKFFNSMGVPQWAQIENSFKVAFNKHPKLKKYFICTPLDREDPRIKNQSWFMDKWEKKIKEWKSFANSNGRDIEFEYWGNSELFDRLTKPENIGKLNYWFGSEEFSDKWFNEKLEESIKNLDKRYTPELNFELPIAKIFDGLSRDKFFQEQFNFQLDSFLKIYNKAISHVTKLKDPVPFEKIKNVITKIKGICDEIDFSEIRTLNQNELTGLLVKAKELSDLLITHFYDLEIEFKNENKVLKKNQAELYNFRWDIDYFIELNNAIYSFKIFINGSTVALFNRPFLLLVGEAGIGKSHLLADIAKKRYENNHYTILLLGQHFTAEEPWSQIKNFLHLNVERDVFLSTLNSKAESTGSRILIFIDAINEGEGKKIWNNYLSGFISAIERYPNLGLALSVRTTYKKLLVPRNLIDNRNIIQVYHYGFINHEYEVSKLFFENYNIKQPSIPLLHPEFSNPLFLKLFCEGLYKKGLQEIPLGYEGISEILNFYLDSINIKISIKHNLPYELNTIPRIIKLIAGNISESGNSYMEFDEAFRLITQFPNSNVIIDKSQFFQDLISEGLLTQNLFWDIKLNQIEGIYITYERFSDHLICAYLIEKHLNLINPKDSFQPNKPLYELIKDASQAHSNQGIIEAMSIQIPELLNLELYELADHAKSFSIVASSLIKSIIWRKNESVTNKIYDYIMDVASELDDIYDYLINTILTITARPNNYFNSDFIHNKLSSMSLADRDGWWTQFIHNKYPGNNEEISSIRRMIDWAWTEDNRKNISDESIRLFCQTMIWFLTSTNRILRDSSTKAIICLLTERIDVLIQLLNSFKEVNDPYVQQRLYAIAYGCTMRTSDTKSLKQLSEYVFETIFNKEYVIPDILLRDYARNIIEFAISKDHIFDFNLNKIRPPYRSEFPSSFPTKNEINISKVNNNQEGFKDYWWSQESILSSMATEHGGGMYGDFGRYIFDACFRYWKDVNTNDLSNLAIKWIFEKYGYDIEKHGMFDRRIKYYHHDRHYVNEERIGKKYQWIALYELLARVSDNFPYYKDSYKINPDIDKYEGPWEPNVRNIDPSVTIKLIKENKFETFWWCKIKYDNWSQSNNEWVFNRADLPNPLELINVFDHDGNEWLILEIHRSWDEPSDIGYDKWENPHKNLWLQINSYLTLKSNHKKIISWAKGKDFMGNWMPSSGDRYEIFSKEYYWSPACETYRKRDYPEYGFSDIDDNVIKMHNLNLAVTAVKYLWSEQFDASKETSISFYKPSEIIFNMLGLKYSKIEGQLINDKNELICFDPSTSHPTHSCLIVRKTELIQKLNENNMDLFWTVLGIKQILSTHYNEKENVGRLNISGVVYFEKDQLKYSPTFFEEKQN